MNKLECGGGLVDDGSAGTVATGGTLLSVPMDYFGGACGGGGMVPGSVRCADVDRGTALGCVDDACTCFNLLCEKFSPYPLPNPSQKFLRGGGWGGAGRYGPTGSMMGGSWRWLPVGDVAM